MGKDEVERLKKGYEPTMYYSNYSMDRYQQLRNKYCQEFGNAYEKGSRVVKY